MFSEPSPPRTLFDLCVHVKEPLLVEVEVASRAKLKNIKDTKIEKFRPTTPNNSCDLGLIAIALLQNYHMSEHLRGGECPWARALPLSIYAQAK